MERTLLIALHGEQKIRQRNAVRDACFENAPRPGGTNDCVLQEDTLRVQVCADVPSSFELFLDIAEVAIEPLILKWLAQEAFDLGRARARPSSVPENARQEPAGLGKQTLSRGRGAAMRTPRGLSSLPATT
jgi:hypothetical protein